MYSNISQKYKFANLFFICTTNRWLLIPYTCLFPYHRSAYKVPIGVFNQTRGDVRTSRRVNASFSRLDWKRLTASRCARLRQWRSYGHNFSPLELEQIWPESLGCCSALKHITLLGQGKRTVSACMEACSKGLLHIFEASGWLPWHGLSFDIVCIAPLGKLVSRFSKSSFRVDCDDACTTVLFPLATNIIQGDIWQSSFGVTLPTFYTDSTNNTSTSTKITDFHLFGDFLAHPGVLVRRENVCVPDKRHSIIQAWRNFCLTLSWRWPGIRKSPHAKFRQCGKKSVLNSGCFKSHHSYFQFDVSTVAPDAYTSSLWDTSRFLSSSSKDNSFFNTGREIKYM